MLLVQGFLLANMGRALWQLQRHDEAIQVLEMAVNQYGEVSPCCLCRKSVSGTCLLWLS
jgi:hypothetical protein